MDINKILIIRYGEVWLKSESVRRQFERVLTGNVRQLFSPGTRLITVPGRLWIHSDKIPSELSKTFGVVSFSSALVCEKNLDEIKSVAKQITKKWKSGTFAIRARRNDKSFSLNSRQLEIAIAEDVNLPVDLTNPKHELTVEIRDKAYLFEKTMRGPGGMPLGSAGKVAAYLRNSDDLIAAWLIMKRGAVTILLDPSASLAKVLQRWSVGRRLKVAKTMKDALKLGAQALVSTSSENTSENGAVILNPLVGFDNKEKVALLKRIRKI